MVYRERVRGFARTSRTVEMPGFEPGYRWVIGLFYMCSIFGILVTGGKDTKQLLPRANASFSAGALAKHPAYPNRFAPPISY